jgi:thermosome
MIVEVAKTQDDEVGDGTTTAVVIAGELLKKAEELLEQNVHPTVIASGYKIAAEEAQTIMESIATKIDLDDEEMLVKVANTAMTGKGAEKAQETLGKLAVAAVRQVVENVNGGWEVDLDNIKIEKKIGGSVEDSTLINGIIVDKERVHSGMPERVKDARIALVATAMEVKETETDAEIRISDPDMLQKFIEQEETMLQKMVDKIKSVGANVVFCQKGIDDLAQHYLAKEGILAVRRVKKSDMKALARATNARVATKIEDLAESDLGKAGLVEERRIAGDEMIFVEDCEDPKSVSLLLRGGTEHFIDSVERALDDAVGVVASVIEDGTVVAGGGAIDMELVRRLGDVADRYSGREQLAIKAFADSLEIIPRTLAENAGLDPIDLLVTLRSRHESNGGNIGLDVFEGEPIDMFDDGILEPLRIKEQAVKSASEAAIMILRIDDVIAASDLGKGAAMGGGGGMPDMGGGGMPGMGM